MLYPGGWEHNLAAIGGFMAIQINDLTSDDKGKAVSVWFADGDVKGVLRDWSVKANLLVIWQEEAFSTCFASPELTNFEIFQHEESA